MSGSVTLQELNVADQDAFVDAIGFVFEGSPHFAAQAWHNRPFATPEDLYQTLRSVIWAAPEPVKLALIRAHPDLAGKAAIAGSLTEDSRREQSSAGLDRLTPEEFATFTRLNAAYRERFRFPFIICVREHTKESILAGFETRLTNSTQQEIDTALTEIAKIARLRLFDALQSA